MFTQKVVRHDVDGILGIHGPNVLAHAVVGDSIAIGHIVVNLVLLMTFRRVLITAEEMYPSIMTVTVRHRNAIRGVTMAER